MAAEAEAAREARAKVRVDRQIDKLRASCAHLNMVLYNFILVQMIGQCKQASNLFFNH